MFRRYKQLLETIYMMEVVLDALLQVLHDRDIVTRSDMQIQILKQEQKKEDERG